MRHFYSGTFMNREDLKEMGVDYPIKLEYYKLISEDITKKKAENFGLEVMKTSYLQDQVKTENMMLENVTEEESIINQLLDILKKNEVTPVNVSYVVEDLLKEIG